MTSDVVKHSLVTISLLVLVAGGGISFGIVQQHEIEAHLQETVGPVKPADVMRRLEAVESEVRKLREELQDR